MRACARACVEILIMIIIIIKKTVQFSIFLVISNPIDELKKKKKKSPLTLIRDKIPAEHQSTPFHLFEVRGGLYCANTHRLLHIKFIQRLLMVQPITIGASGWNGVAKVKV